MSTNASPLRIIWVRFSRRGDTPGGASVVVKLPFSVRSSLRLGSAALPYLLLGLGFGLLVLGMAYNSLTWDESTHIAVGYSVLARGRDAYWLLYEHGQPPLVNALEALFLYGVNPHIPLEELNGWKTSVALYCQAFTAHSFSVSQFQVLPRLAPAFLTVLLAAIIYRWGKDLWGGKAAVLGLALCVCDPTLLAHGRLATTDVGVVAFGTAALYCVWRWVRRPSWRLSLAAGCLLGLTLLSKYSGVFWAAAAVITLTAADLRRGGRKLPSARFLGRGLTLLFVGLAVIWAAYGFSWGQMPSLAVKLPAADYWGGLVHQSGSVATRWTYALGYRGYGGWWWYFPAAFLIKNPVAFLILLGVGAVALLISAPRRFLWISFFPAMYTIAAVYSRFNIGYRHILPVHPFFYLIIGGGVWRGLRGSLRFAWLKALVVAGLLGWQIASVLQTWPNDLAYFNELVGGPERGYKYLVDSNLDWGQTPPEVDKAIVRAYPGIHTAPPSRPHSPAAGRYLVDASALQGLGDRFVYEWFRHVEPRQVVNATRLIYQAPPFDPSWLAQCNVPTPPLNDMALAQEFNRADWRDVHFDCTQTWIYPGGVVTNGLYAFNYELYSSPVFDVSSLAAGLPIPRADFVARHISGARLSFDRPWLGEKDAYSAAGYVLYEAAPGLASLPQLGRAYAGSAELTPAMAQANLMASAPLQVGEVFTFLGIKTVRHTDGLEVETWWKYIKEGPLDRPFSIMAHLVQPDGTTVAVADGLGISPLALRRGDVVVQRHWFPDVPAGQVFWLQTGIYWLDNFERWLINGNLPSDTLLLPVLDETAQ